MMGVSKTGVSMGGVPNRCAATGSRQLSAEGGGAFQKIAERSNTAAVAEMIDDRQDGLQGGRLRAKGRISGKRRQPGEPPGTGRETTHSMGHGRSIPALQPIRQDDDQRATRGAREA